jgi:acyl-CoA synthetase (AMP-forming)/AMP-acid ligase II
MRGSLPGEFAPAVERLRAGLPRVERLVTLDGAAGGVGWESLADWMAADPDPGGARRIRPDDDLLQLYTSGTTGNPKGVVLTHRAVLANVAQIAAVCQGPPGERSLVAAPLFHAAAVPTTFAPIGWGGSLRIHEGFQAAEVVRQLDEERVGFAVLVPTMLQASLQVPGATQRRYAGLRLVYYGSSPIAEGTLRRAMRVLGCGFVQSYGMTEASQALTFLTAADHERGWPAIPTCWARPAGRRPTPSSASSTPAGSTPRATCTCGTGRPT